MDYNKIRKIENAGRKRLIIISVIVLAAAITALIIVLSVKNDREHSLHPDLSRNISEQMTVSPKEDMNQNMQIEPTPDTEVAQTEIPTQEPTQAPQLARRGTAEPIPEDIRNYMSGRSMKENANISFDDLSYLTIPHYNFDDNVVAGHLVVNASLAEEVLDIFAELYDIKYPIERMELIDNYGADDFQSIEANNTSCFNYRESTSGSGKISNHGYGRAIDINPQINPYVNSSGTGSHSNAAEYWSRNPDAWSSSIARRAFIGPDTEIYRIFVDKHGWSWGGNWSSYRDYQHFEKLY